MNVLVAVDNSEVCHDCPSLMFSSRLQNIVVCIAATKGLTDPLTDNSQATLRLVDFAAKHFHGANSPKLVTACEFLTAAIGV